MNGMLIFLIEIFSIIINVSTVTFDEFHAFLLNKSINFLKKIFLTPKGSVCYI